MARKAGHLYKTLIINKDDETHSENNRADCAGNQRMRTDSKCTDKEDGGDGAVGEHDEGRAGL